MTYNFRLQESRHWPVSSWQNKQAAILVRFSLLCKCCFSIEEIFVSRSGPHEDYWEERTLEAVWTEFKGPMGGCLL